MNDNDFIFLMTEWITDAKKSRFLEQRAHRGIQKSIQFGRNNPETCEIKRNESNMQMCRECGHFIGQEKWNLKENGIHFCNGCGRKIKHEK